MTRDTEWAGTELAAGQVVHGVLIAGNRDPEVFEDPDRLDIRRRNAKEHNALGWGQKFCLGPASRRLEGQVVYSTLARRFPDMEMIDEANLVWRGPSFLRRLEALPVRLRRLSAVKHRVGGRRATPPAVRLGESQNERWFGICYPNRHQEEIDGT